MNTAVEMDCAIDRRVVLFSYQQRESEQQISLQACTELKVESELRDVYLVQLNQALP